MYTGNIFEWRVLNVRIAVYPCVYREHLWRLVHIFQTRGLSLCIQGTYHQHYLPENGLRFIPVHTGNIHLVGVINALEAVYPCAYREHFAVAKLRNHIPGLSLCIQGTYKYSLLYIHIFRFIPVHTGNMSTCLICISGLSVYPCAYREHVRAMRADDKLGGLSLCIQGTLTSIVFQFTPLRFIPVHTGNMKSNSKFILYLTVYPCAYREHTNYNILFYN